MDTGSAQPDSEDKRKPKALKPYLALWLCLVASAGLAVTAILSQG